MVSCTRPQFMLAEAKNKNTFFRYLKNVNLNEKNDLKTHSFKIYVNWYMPTLKLSRNSLYMYKRFKFRSFFFFFFFLPLLDSKSIGCIPKFVISQFAITEDFCKDLLKICCGLIFY